MEPSEDLRAVRKPVALQMHGMLVLLQPVVRIPANAASCCSRPRVSQFCSTLRMKKVVSGSETYSAQWETRQALSTSRTKS